jgi:methyl-accepting chemotaxis protein
VRDRNISLLARILAVTLGGVLFTGLLAIFLSLGGIASLSRSVVDAIYGRILEGAAKSFIASVGVNYGELALAEGRLVGEGGSPIAKSSQAVDALSRGSTVEASIYGYSGGAFRVEQTSVRKADGKRAVGLELPRGSAAAAALAAGEDYRGKVEIEGKSFIASLSPVQGGDGAVIGALFVGQSIADVDELTVDAYRAAVVRILGGTALAILLSGLFATLALRSSIVPLRQTVLLLKGIASDGGDLTTRIEAKRSDETGALARHFNEFAERLRREFARMKSGAADFDGVARELERSSSATAVAVGTISREIGALRGRIVEQGASVAESTTERVLDLAERVARLKLASREGGQALEAAAAEVVSAARQSERLFELNELVASVASRTNLLAMNAAIEAAHAGQAGRGFAVVASEIRSLAEESAASAKQTAAELKAIKAGIDRIVGASGLAEAAFSRIGESVTRTDAALAEISEDMASQRSGALEALSGLAAIREATRSIKDGSAEMGTGGSLALAEMRRLLSLSMAIEEGVGAISREADIISAQAGSAAEAARVNAASAAALWAELSLYRTEPEEEGRLEPLPA